MYVYEHMYCQYSNSGFSLTLKEPENTLPFFSRSFWNTLPGLSFSFYAFIFTLTSVNSGNTNSFIISQIKNIIKKDENV